MVYGLAGTPTVQHLRDYGFTQVSSIGGLGGDIVGATTAILPDVSSLPGCDANSQYILWGFIAGTNQTAGVKQLVGYLIHTGVAHAAYDGTAAIDDAVVLAFQASKEGPFFWSTDHPVGIPKGAGLSLDADGYAHATSGNIVYVYYTIKK
tara:strand:+ start:55 stop:504 length:450 start_codon:yes stop_codon:yes gene_type:complete